MVIKGLEKACLFIGSPRHASKCAGYLHKVIPRCPQRWGYKARLRPKQGPGLSGPHSLPLPAACPDGSDFWKSVHFTDYSQHSQMVMALTLRCPLKLEASLCQKWGWNTLCEDLPNATAQESEGVSPLPPAPGLEQAGLGPKALLPD